MLAVIHHANGRIVCDRYHNAVGFGFDQSHFHLHDVRGRHLASIDAEDVFHVDIDGRTVYSHADEAYVDGHPAI